MSVIDRVQDTLAYLARDFGEASVPDILTLTGEEWDALEDELAAEADRRVAPGYLKYCIYYRDKIVRLVRRGPYVEPPPPTSEQMKLPMLELGDPAPELAAPWTPHPLYPSTDYPWREQDTRLDQFRQEYRGTWILPPPLPSGNFWTKLRTR